MNHVGCTCDVTKITWMKIYKRYDWRTSGPHHLESYMSGERPREAIK